MKSITSSGYTQDKRKYYANKDFPELNMKCRFQVRITAILRYITINIHVSVLMIFTHPV